MTERVGMVGMWLRGLKVVLLSAPLMLPLYLINGLLFGYADHYVGRGIVLVKEDALLAAQVSQGFGFLAGILGLYTLLQIYKRKTASWGSWIPSLFLPSALMVSLSSGWASTMPASQGELILSMGHRLGLELAWVCTIGGLLYGGWVCLSYTYFTTGKINYKASIARWKGAGVGYLGPHGGSTLLIYLGLQVLVPGIVYAVIYSFVNHAAILLPKTPSAFQTSSRTSTGLRRPIVLLLLFSMLPMFLLRIAGPVWIEGMAHRLGYASNFVTDTGAFNGTDAWGNVVAMQFGASWAGHFWSEGLALGMGAYLSGIAACGLTWAFIQRNAAVEEGSESVASGSEEEADSGQSTHG